MSFSAGVFQKLYVWATEAIGGPIDITKLDAQESDFATGLSTCILRDGTGLPTTDIPWNSKKITGLAAPTNSFDAASYVVSSFTGTITGTSGSLTGTVRYRLTGNVITMWVDSAITNTLGNVNTMTMTGVANAARPTVARNVPCAALAGGTGSGNDLGGAIVGTSGTITFWRNVVVGSDITPSVSSFPSTSSITKGLLAGWCITYPI